MPLHAVSVSQAFPLRDRSISVGGTICGVNHSFIQSAAVFVLSARPLPRRPAPSPYFQPSGSWRSVSPSKFLGNALQGSRTCLSVSHLTVKPFSASQLQPTRFYFRSATMNIFRLTGDLSHLAAIIILLLKIWKSRSCA
ncbi:hypothetical protein GOODEAATRI_031751, partial [Goodea atripinnis]